MVPPASHRIPRARWYSGYSPYCRSFVYGTLTLFRRTSHSVQLPLSSVTLSSTPQVLLPGFGLFRFRSPLLTESRLISLPPPTEMFQFSGFPPYAYGFSARSRGVTRAGFPHSDIHGSMPICGSPWLFAAYRVLRRLPVPRHSPCALSSLTSSMLVLAFALC